jgi:hypothetical protein
MKKSLVFLSMLILAVVPFTTIAKNKAEIPEYTVEGLKLVPGTKDIAYVWAEEGADLSQYERIYLVEPGVAFKKNWQRDQNRSSVDLGSRVKTSDVERIKAKVKELFVEVFTEELAAGGYTMAEERAEDVLIVRPAILDLYITAPDIQSAGRSASFTTSAGSMTLYLELYDSVTDDLLAKALDPTSDRDNGMMQWQTGVANRAMAKRMMKPWAVALREGLDRARTQTGEDK